MLKETVQLTEIYHVLCNVYYTLQFICLKILSFFFNVFHCLAKLGLLPVSLCSVLLALVHWPCVAFILNVYICPHCSPSTTQERLLKIPQPSRSPWALTALTENTSRLDPELDQFTTADFELQFRATSFRTGTHGAESNRKKGWKETQIIKYECIIRA